MKKLSSLLILAALAGFTGACATAGTAPSTKPDPVILETAVARLTGVHACQRICGTPVNAAESAKVLGVIADVRASLATGQVLGVVEAALLPRVSPKWAPDVQALFPVVEAYIPRTAKVIPGSNPDKIIQGLLTGCASSCTPVKAAATSGADPWGLMAGGSLVEPWGVKAGGSGADPWGSDGGGGVDPWGRIAAVVTAPQ